MTNGEWLRKQDDETMADFIAEGEAYARVLSVTDGGNNHCKRYDNKMVEVRA